jgi:signal transduction histidine kinase
MHVSALPTSTVEKGIGALRVAALVVAPIAIVLADLDTGWLVVVGLSYVLLALGTAAMWAWGRRTGWGSRWLLPAGFALDLAVATGFVLAFAHQEPSIAWALAYVVLADAALRFSMAGVVAGFVLAVVLFAVQAWLHERAVPGDFDAAAYVYVGASLLGVAGVLATFTRVIQKQARAAGEQGLMLADAQRMRERLIATSSHEFRGSLTAILVGVQTVRANIDRLRPEQVTKVLGDVAGQAEHMQRLVEDLLYAARARSDNVGVRPRVDDAADTVNRALAAASRHRRDHMLEMSIERVVCELDHERLQQVVRNLVENAFKYTPPGGRVTVISRHADGVLEVRVADTGPGIPVADRERIFEPFRRRRSENDASDSVGLGLYLTSQIIQAMGGSLELLSPAEGSEFVIRVPAPRAKRQPAMGAHRRPGPAQ